MIWLARWNLLYFSLLSLNCSQFYSSKKVRSTFRKHFFFHSESFIVDGNPIMPFRCLQGEETNIFSSRSDFSLLLNISEAEVESICGWTIITVQQPMIDVVFGTNVNVSNRMCHSFRKSALTQLFSILAKRIPAIDINFLELITLVSCRNRFFVLKLILVAVHSEIAILRFYFLQ